MWHGQHRIAEVQFYFQVGDPDSDDPNEEVQRAAVASLYSLPDQALLQGSYGTLYACEYRSQDRLILVPLPDILSVVSMQPLPQQPNDARQLWFLLEKSGLDDMALALYDRDLDNADG